jgi:hypothetical protein
LGWRWPRRSDRAAVSANIGDRFEKVRREARDRRDAAEEREERVERNRERDDDFLVRHHERSAGVQAAVAAMAERQRLVDVAAEGSSLASRPLTRPKTWTAAAPDQEPACAARSAAGPAFGPAPGG